MTPQDTSAPPSQPPAPLFRISLGNAMLLSVLYLVAGALNELARQAFNWRWTEKVSEHMEEFPARTLRMLGLFGPLKRAFLDGLIGALGVRMALGLTMVLLIFALALGVGAMMWVGRFAWEKVQAARR